MTWKELALKIMALTPEQQSTDVTIFDDNDGEYIKADELIIAEDNDILNEGHPFLDLRR